MESILTKYGSLTGIVWADYYPDGSLSQCMLNVYNKLATPFGDLIPQYSDSGARRKYTRSLSFYPNGDLKTISLQEQTAVATSAGILPAELLTFYEGDRLCRIFPLNGKVTGFWSEADEYKLAREFPFELPVAEFELKIISIHFYENGAIQSVTIWPQDSLVVQTPVGQIPARIGFALYPDGSLQSVEPLKPWPVKTPIGEIAAYDLNANGIAADVNSLQFTPTGEVKSLITSSDRIVLTGRDGSQIWHEPGSAPNICNDEKLEPVPLRIELGADGVVCFDKRSCYKRSEFDFAVQSVSLAVERLCDDCSGYDE
jgi:antitoxin component YwqK of YwqJK toxin-antitoxin module